MFYKYVEKNALSLVPTHIHTFKNKCTIWTEIMENYA